MPPEGPMNIEPVPVIEEVPVAASVDGETVEQVIEVKEHAPVQFPTAQPRLTSQASKTLKALQGR